MSFINAFFLFAISAAVLPVLYHLIRQMRAKKVPFSSLMFLRATPKELIKRRRLRDLLLMAVRACLFALLALVFARPFVPQEVLPFVPQRANRSVVLLVDASYSMQAGDRFEAARREALALLGTAAGEDEFSVVAFADAPQQLTPLSRDLALHREVLEGTLKVTNRPTDFYRALRTAEEILKEARHPERQVVLISDFQRAGWSGSFDNWKLGGDVAFVPVTVAGDVPGNAYVDAFELSRRRTGAQVALRYDARVLAQGDAAGREGAAQLLVDGREVGTRRLPPAPSSHLTFQQIAPREGVFQGMVTLADDALALDNRFFFTYAVQGQPTLLFIAEGPAAAAGDVFFLQRAFDLGEDALYRFTVGDRSRLSRAELRRHAVVFLADPSPLSAAQVSVLRGYVEEGGSLIVSFGERADPAALSGALAGLGLGRADRVANPRAEQGQDAIIGEVDLRHPVFNLFATSGTGTILRPRFRRYLAVAPDSGAAVVGAYDTGDPFLIERRLGSGKVLAYTATFGTGWTDFPIDEMYVPFVYELVRYAASDADAKHLFTVGDVVPLEGPPGAEWEVQAPKDRLFKVVLDAEGQGFFRETEEPGHYVAARGAERFAFSVNVDPRESDLEARDEEEVYAAVVSPSRDGAAPAQTAAVAVTDEEKEQKLWRYLLLLVIALFVLETFLANRSQRLPIRKFAGAEAGRG